MSRRTRLEELHDETFEPDDPDRELDDAEPDEDDEAFDDPDPDEDFQDLQQLTPREQAREALAVTAGNLRSLGPAGAVPVTYRQWLQVVEAALKALEQEIAEP